MRAANDNGLRFLSVCSGIEAASMITTPNFAACLKGAQHDN